jgi:eukaryotic-like serine/threonine-protein kinase
MSIDNPQPSRPQRWLPWIALAAALGLAYWSFDWAIGAAIHNRRVVKVPDLGGKSLNDALTQLSPLHLGIAKDGEQFDKSFPAGTIVRQNPPKDMEVREGRIVRVTVSQGGESLFVPDIIGQPLRNAQTALQNAGLNMGEIDRRPSLRFEKDVVMATDPAASQAVSKNALVNLIVSGGAPGADVQLTPDFVGKNVNDVKAWAASHQIPVVTREENDLGKGAGEVLTQSPAADSSIRLGETLTIVVNAGGSSTVGPSIRYDVSKGGNGDKDVRIYVVDEAGEHEVFRHAQAPGSRVEVTPAVKGRSRARIFENGIMMEEQEMQ